MISEIYLYNVIACWIIAGSCFASVFGLFDFLGGIYFESSMMTVISAPSFNKKSLPIIYKDDWPIRRCFYRFFGHCYLVLAARAGPLYLRIVTG